MVDTPALSETGWTADTWAALLSARDAATAVNDDNGATQEEVDAAADDLGEAITGLTTA